MMHHSQETLPIKRHIFCTPVTLNTQDLEKLDNGSKLTLYQRQVCCPHSPHSTELTVHKTTADVHPSTVQLTLNNTDVQKKPKNICHGSCCWGSVHTCFPLPDSKCVGAVHDWTHNSGNIAALCIFRTLQSAGWEPLLLLQPSPVQSSPAVSEVQLL